MNIHECSDVLFHRFILGMFGGCISTEGYRRSTLECWFTQSCIDLVLALMYSSATVLAMDASIPTRFPVGSTTAGSIIDELFIESWTNESNYSNYFDACAPILCEYSRREKANSIYILSMLLGLYGGLAAIWRCLAWYGVQFGFWMMARCRTRVTPHQDSINEQ